MTIKPEEKIQKLDMDIFADMVYQNAINKGFHDKPETEDEFIERCCNNLHDEVSELHTAWRDNKLNDPCDKASAMFNLGLRPLTCKEEELADIIIRALDNARKLNVNIVEACWIKHQYNTTRSKRHGGKRS